MRGTSITSVVLQQLCIPTASGICASYYCIVRWYCCGGVMNHVCDEVGCYCLRHLCWGSRDMMPAMVPPTALGWGGRLCLLSVVDVVAGYCCMPCREVHDSTLLFYACVYYGWAAVNRRRLKSQDCRDGCRYFHVKTRRGNKGLKIVSVCVCGVLRP